MECVTTVASGFGASGAIHELYGGISVTQDCVPLSFRRSGWEDMTRMCSLWLRTNFCGCAGSCEAMTLAGWAPGLAALEARGWRCAFDRPSLLLPQFEAGPFGCILLTLSAMLSRSLEL